MVSAVDCRPFVFALFKPLAGDHLKGVGALEDHQPLGFLLCLPRIVSGGEHLACLRTPLAGVSQADFRIHAQCQQLFLARKEVFQPPVFAAGGHD